MWPWGSKFIMKNIKYKSLNNVVCHFPEWDNSFDTYWDTYCQMYTFNFCVHLLQGLVDDVLPVMLLKNVEGETITILEVAGRVVTSSTVDHSRPLAGVAFSNANTLRISPVLPYSKSVYRARAPSYRVTDITLAVPTIHGPLPNPRS